MKKISALITLSVIIVSSVSGQSDEQNWLSGMEKTASLYDARGFMRDQSRTVDGSVSISSLNGNVQYQYPISQMTVGDSPIRFSLSYNQNASFTAFRKYDYLADYWHSFKRNRPVWILGVNGFAVQAFTSTSRNVLRPGLRGNAVVGGGIYRPMYDEQDMNWLLDGYDHCNRMKRVPDLLPSSLFEDVIRLLREDGSVLELVRRDHFTPAPADEWNTDLYGDQPYVGVYVTTDANSDAYARVTIDKSQKSKYSTELIKAQFSDNDGIIPHHLLPRQVEYFPGDGTSMIFSEVVVPYGVEPYNADYDLLGESDLDPNTSDVYFSGYRDASPSVFYLTAIRKANVDIVKFEYDGHNGEEPGGVSVQTKRGRAKLTSFDHHQISYGLNGATITALGKKTELLFNDASISGVAALDAVNNDDPNDGGHVYNYDHSSEVWNDPSAYYTWTGLLTEIIDPELRKTEFSYNFNDIAVYNASFPRPLSTDNVDPQYTSNPDVSKTVLTLRYKQMTSVSNQVAKYEIHYPIFALLPPPQVHPLLVSKLPPYVDLTYSYDPMELPRVYDYRTSSVALKLVKHDRVGTNSVLGQSTTGAVLWEEMYIRNDQHYSDNFEGTAKVGAVRTTYGSGAATNVQVTETTYRRYESTPSYFNLLTNTFPERKLTLTTPVKSVVSTEVPNANGEIQTVKEITETLYPFAEGHSTWHHNRLQPNSSISSTVVTSAGQGGTTENTFLRTQNDYTYGYDAAFKMNYSSTLTAREDLVEAQFCNPLLTDTILDYRYTLPLANQPAEWVVDLVKTRRFKSLGSRVVSINLYPNITKLELEQRWMRYWKEKTTWTDGEAWHEFFNAGSNPPWRLYKGKPPEPDDHGVDDNDDDVVVMQVGVAPFFSLPLESKVYRASQSNVFETLTLNSYNEVDLISEPVTPYDPVEVSPSYGTLASTSTFSRDLQRLTTISYGYDFANRPYGTVSKLSAISDDIGIQTRLYYQGNYGYDPTWVVGGIAEGKRVSNSPNVGGAISPTKVNNQYQVNLRTLGTSILDLPTHTKTRVRKANASGLVDNYYIKRAQAYDVLGGVSTSIDPNGYVSEYEYDNLGRLKTAWLPHDLPDLQSADLILPNYDDLTQFRTYEAVGSVDDERKFEHLLCCNSNDNVPIVRPATSFEAAGSGVLRYEIPGIGSEGWFIVGTKKHLRPVCNNLFGLCPSNTSQPLAVPPGGGCSYDRCVVYERLTSYPVWKGSFKMLRSEHRNITSASIRFALRRITDMGPCFPLTFILRAQDGSVLRKWDRVVNCGTKIEGPKQGEQVSSVVANNGSSTTSDLVADFVFSVPELENVLLSSGSPTNSDPIEVSVEVQTDPSATGFATFNSVELELTGSFLEWERTDLTDFTLAYRYHDNEQRVVGVYSKIDDRSQTIDASQYPTQPTNAYTRHARRRITFTTDDLVQKDESNFGADYGALLGSSIMNPGPTLTKTCFDGAGRVIKSVSPKAFEVSTDYDNMGNLKTVQIEDAQYAWTGINTGTPALVLSPGARTTHTVTIKTPLEYGIPEPVASRFGEYCRREVMITSDPVAASLVSRKQATFYDYRGRKVLSVDGYTENGFQDGFLIPRIVGSDVNLVTQYAYDYMDRIVEIVNPGGQVITYEYDDLGNISSSTQADLGRVDYSYSKSGQLRFSQSQLQRAASKINFRQYDDLGRPLIIGEATIEPPLGDPQPNMFSMLQPDNLHATGENIPTLNTTLFNDPIPEVRRIYTPLMGAFEQSVPITEEMKIVDNGVPCGDLLALTQSDRFKPVHPIGLDLLMHMATNYVRPNVIAPIQEFENIAQFPEFVLQAIWYDELPPKAGAVFGGMPTAAAWNRLAPTGTVRNLKEKASIVAYRTHGGQPFHYIVRSYDERGRVEAIIRLTENLGFDAVYYSYNSMNSVVSIHTVDPFNQHATFYGYDASGRVSGVWTAQSPNGLGLSTMPYMPQLMGRPVGAPDALYTYDVENNITSVAYPAIGVISTTTYNEAGTKMRSLTQKSNTVLFDQRLNYDVLGQINKQFVSQGGATIQNAQYLYDKVGRLSQWSRTVGNQPAWQIENYAYDAVGNRLLRELVAGGPPDVRTYMHGGMPGGLQPNTLTAVTGLNNQPLDALTYNPNGALALRQRDKTADLYRTQRLETYEYDAFNLIERFTLRRDAVPDQPGSTCMADAALAPMDDWRYRFGPLQEREQKRQYATSGDIAREGLAWTYTLLGADAKQLATYNGVEGAFCGEDANTVWLWPAEYNSYGPAQTRIITRPQGAKEFPIADHLGSTRLTLSQTGVVLQRIDYEPFGSEINEAGDGARTSYIGREKDNESDLGFYGVRMYEPEYGRFMSVDPLWMLYCSMQVYQYAANKPTIFIDYGGRWIEAKTEAAKDAVRSTVDVEFAKNYIAFDKNGILNTELIVEGALKTMADPESNVGKLAYLAVLEETIQVVVSFDEKFQTMNQQKGQIEVVSFEDTEPDGTYSFSPAITLAPRSAAAKTGLPLNLPASPNGMWNVVLDYTPNYSTGTNLAQKTAHELFAHVWLGIRILGGARYPTAWHIRPANKVVLKATERAEKEANEGGKK